MLRVTIDEVLKEREKSIYWLANETGLTYRRLISVCKNQTSSISFDYIEKICISLGCTPNDIIKIE
jgi:putative transcriptional regulator